MLRSVRSLLATITSIVQKVYWLLSKILFCLCMDPEYHNQVDKFTKNSKKDAYNLHIQHQLFLLAQEKNNV